MSADEAPFDALLRDWQELAAGDRKAILRRLPAARRLEFQRLITAFEADRSVTEGQRYRGYSAWLARLLADCETGSPNDERVKPALRAAMIEGHELASGSAAAHPAPPSAPDFARALIQRVKEAL